MARASRNPNLGDQDLHLALDQRSKLICNDALEPANLRQKVRPSFARLLKKARAPEGGRGAARLPRQLLPDSFVDSLHAVQAGAAHGPDLGAGRTVRRNGVMTHRIARPARRIWAGLFHAQGAGITETTPKPKRRRWRWIIAGVLLSVIVTGWWQRPRLEQRFVGKWNVRSRNVRSQVHSAEFQDLVYEFRADGKLLFGRFGKQSVTLWGVQGDRLIIGDDGRFYPWSIAANYLASLLRSPRLKLDVAVDEIIAVSDNEITLRTDNGRRIETLSRASGGAPGLRKED